MVTTTVKRSSKFLLMFIVAFILFMPLSSVSASGGFVDTPKSSSSKTAEPVTIKIPSSDTSNIERLKTTLVEKGLVTGDQWLAESNTKSTSKGGDIAVLKLSPTEVVFYPDNYSQITAKEQKKFASKFVEELNASDVTGNTKNLIYAQMQNSSTELAPHMITAILDEVSATKQMGKVMQIVSPFLPVLSIIVGIGTIIVVFLLILSTVADLAFITIPLFRTKVSGDGKSGEKVPFISHDAQSVVSQTESSTGGEGYTNPVLLYFKRRMITYLVFGICLFYLVFGGFSALVTSLLGLVGGFGAGM